MVLLPTSQVGGAEKVAAMIARFGHTSSMDVDLCSLDTSVRGVDRYGVIAKKINTRTLTLALINDTYDVVFTTHFKLSILIALLRLLFFSSTKHVVRESTVFRDRFGRVKTSLYTIGYKFIYRNIDAVIFQSEEQLSRFSTDIPSSVPRHVLLNPYQSSKVSELYSSDSEEKVIIGCGRLIKEKGFDLLILAFYQLGLEGLGYRLKILGDGPCFADLSSLIKALKLDSAVELSGFVGNPSAYFSSASLCVVSSRVEGFPNVLLEMLDTSSRVISTRCAGGVAEIEGILLCEPNDLGSLKDALRMACVEKRENLFDPRLSRLTLRDRSPEKFVSQFASLCEGLVYG